MNTITAVRHEPVSIAGCHVLAAISEAQRAYFSPRHVCQALQIDWKSQYQKIIDDPALKSCVVNITIQVSGQGRATVMLPVEMAQGWLFTIKKVKPEYQDRLNQFRLECFQALHQWFTESHSEPKAPAVETGLTSQALRIIADEIDALRGEVYAVKSHLRRQDLEIAQLRMLRTAPRHLTMIVNQDQIGLDLNPPAAPKAIAKGGTHASPCPHTRRGHHRLLKDGRKVWVRPALVSKKPH